MKTKIQLAFPYSEDFKQGYLNTNREPRRVVLLVKKNGAKTSTSYARYLLSCHLHRYLTKQEHVDHIDGNCLNDDLHNLQILSQLENNRKSVKTKAFMTLRCPICGKFFTKEKRQLASKLRNGKKPTCSRSCGGKQSYRTCIGSAS